MEVLCGSESGVYSSGNSWNGPLGGMDFNDTLSRENE